MDANTPATQAFPQGDPLNEGPTMGASIKEGPMNEGRMNEGPIGEDPISYGTSSDIPGSQKPTPVNTGRLARPKGLNVSAVVLGLVTAILAGLIIANETMNLEIDWSGKWPGAIVGIGLLFVVLGAIGLVRRHDDI